MKFSTLHLAMMASALLLKKASGDSDLFSAVGDDKLDKDLFYQDPGLFADLGDSSDVAPLLVSDAQEPLFSEEPQGIQLSDDDLVGAEMLSSCSDNTNKPIGKLRNRGLTCSNDPNAPLELPDLSNLLNKIDGGSYSPAFDAWRQTSADLEKKMKQINAFCSKAPLFPVPVCGLDNPYRQPEVSIPPSLVGSALSNFPLYRIDNARLCELIFLFNLSFSP